MVVSTNGVNILTSERALYNNKINEFMGYPAYQMTDKYWFPWYDDVNMTTTFIIARP